ncbi:MAG: hypothetical protein RLZ98_948 [Pseudomonadota bacterium]
MGVKVKICGLRTAEALVAALEGGADYVGLVFFPPSPRNVGLVEASSLAALARGRAEIVALMVDPEDSLVDQVVQIVAPDFIQLHGSESVERCAGIRRRSGRPIIKAIKVETRADVEAGLEYAGVADILLFDAKAPARIQGALPGGNGLSFDWQLLDGIALRHPFMLSGGLDPANVATAIRLTGAAAVDVSSGVERTPGDKDPALIAAFLAAVRSA